MAVDVTKLIQKANSAIERRNYDLAIFSYKQALMFQPENIDAREKLRACQTRAANERASSPLVATLKALLPYVKAQVYALLGKHEEAILATEDALTANPGFVGAMRRLATSAVGLEWHELACWQLQEILNRHDPDDTDVMYDLVDNLKEIGRVNEALELCTRIRELEPDSDIDSLERELAANQTATVFERGATDGAHTIVKDESERRELEIESQIARTDEARRVKIAAIQKRLDERPDDYKLLLRIGDEYFNFDDFDTGYGKAKEAYEKAKAITPSDHNIDAKLGDLEIKRLRLIALAHKKAADAGDAEAQKLYKQAYTAMVKFQIKEFEQRVHNQPLIAAYHHQLGKLYLQTQQYDKGVAEFQQSCKDPKHAVEAYTRMGQCFMGMDQLDLAIDMFVRGIEGQEVFAKIKETTYFLAEAYQETGRLQDALEQFTRIFEDDINFKDVKTRVNDLRKRIKEQQE